MTETPEIRRKRLFMRANHRGTKEMDIILGRWAALRLDAATPETLDLFEALMEENDQDLYLWVSNQAAPPAQFNAIVADLRSVMGRSTAFD